MGRIDIILPDDLELKFRKHCFETYGYKKGSLTKGIKNALEEWIVQHKITEFMKRVFGRN